MKLKLFITLISAILLTGCASQTLSEPEAMVQMSTSPPRVVYVPNPSSTVNDLTVSNVVANFARLNPGSRSSLKQVEEIIPVKAEDGSNLMYIVTTEKIW